MYDSGRVQMLDAAQHLVQQVRHPLVVQVHLDKRDMEVICYLDISEICKTIAKKLFPHLYDLAQVGVHQLHHQVHVLELLERALRRECVQQSNYLGGRRREESPERTIDSIRAIGV